MAGVCTEACSPLESCHLCGLAIISSICWVFSCSAVDKINSNKKHNKVTSIDVFLYRISMSTKRRYQEHNKQQTTQERVKKGITFSFSKWFYTMNIFNWIYNTHRWDEVRVMDLFNCKVHSMWGNQICKCTNMYKYMKI